MIKNIVQSKRRQKKKKTKKIKEQRTYGVNRKQENGKNKLNTSVIKLNGKGLNTLINKRKRPSDWILKIQLYAIYRDVL